MPRYRTNAPFLALALLSFLAALWAGLIRIGWTWPPLLPALPGSHGPLMVAGFLGTLIGLERAVALRATWMYIGPLLSGLGALLIIFATSSTGGILLLTSGSFFLVGIFYVILRKQFAAYTLTMALGALFFAIGNVLWLSGWSIPRVVLWWIAFLVLTIAGERLELGKLQRISRLTNLAFTFCITLMIVGLFIAAITHSLGTRLFGLGLIALASWFLANDISRRTIRQPGLPRYAAYCLLSGFIWLGIGGLLGITLGGMAGGLGYDAFLHSILVGFVISMIFGHAPIIFPAVLGFPVGFTNNFYFPLVLLHSSLVMRLAGDLATNAVLRRWGGLVNGVAVLLFLGIVITTILIERQKSLAKRI